MAKKTADQEPDASTEATAEGRPGKDGESVSGYFRAIFQANPKLLKERSNEALLQRWLDDHPGHDEVPERVKQGLANVKSILRKKLGKRGRPRREEQPAQEAAPASAARPSRQTAARLEQLEHSIDEALTLAKQIDREGLHDIIRHLRVARNRVVLQMGVE